MTESQIPSAPILLTEDEVQQLQKKAERAQKRSALIKKISTHATAASIGFLTAVACVVVVTKKDNETLENSEPPFETEQ